MSRKLEREILRNQKQNKKINHDPKSRTKQSQSKYETVFKGRNFILPIILVMLSFFFMVILNLLGDRDTMYWVAIFSYWLLAAMFFLKRPYLAIKQGELTTLRFTKEQTLKSSDIEQILIEDSNIVIAAKGKSFRWVFTKLTNLYPIEDMSKALQDFAMKYSVPLKDKRTTNEG